MCFNHIVVSSNPIFLGTFHNAKEHQYSLRPDLFHIVVSFMCTLVHSLCISIGKFGSKMSTLIRNFGSEIIILHPKFEITLGILLSEDLFQIILSLLCSLVYLLCISIRNFGSKMSTLIRKSRWDMVILHRKIHITLPILPSEISDGTLQNDAKFWMAQMWVTSMSVKMQLMLSKRDQHVATKQL